MKPFLLALAVFLLGGMTGSGNVDEVLPKGQIDPCNLYGAVFVEQVESFADYKVFKEDDEVFSDLIVFREQAKSFADRNGLWFFTDVKGFADFTIAFTEVRGFADFSVHITEFKSLAGCKK